MSSSHQFFPPNLPFPSLPFPSLPFHSLPFSSLPFPSLPPILPTRTFSPFHPSTVILSLLHPSRIKTFIIAEYMYPFSNTPIYAREKKKNRLPIEKIL